MPNLGSLLRFIAFNFILPVKTLDVEHRFGCRASIHYKLLPKSVYVFPTQVLSPLVNLDEDNVLKMDEYEWLCDSI